jgi:hypothetical protein
METWPLLDSNLPCAHSKGRVFLVVFMVYASINQLASFGFLDFNSVELN